MSTHTVSLVFTLLLVDAKTSFFIAGSDFVRGCGEDLGLGNGMGLEYCGAASMMLTVAHAEYMR